MQSNVSIYSPSCQCQLCEPVMKIDAEMKILTNIKFEWKKVAFSQNYLKGDDSAAYTDDCSGDDGDEDYLQD